MSLPSTPTNGQRGDNVYLSILNTKLFHSVHCSRNSIVALNLGPVATLTLVLVYMLAAATYAKPSPSSGPSAAKLGPKGL